MTSESSGVDFESAPLLSFSLAQGGGKVFFRFFEYALFLSTSPAVADTCPLHIVYVVIAIRAPKTQ